MLINPIAKQATIDPPIVFIVECLWDKESIVDIDLYVRGPDGTLTYFGNKDGSYMFLERDDLGKSNDTYIINGETIEVKRNYEMITMSQLPAGEYVINVHYYSKEGNDEEITVKATRTAPYQRVIERTVTLSPRQETTIISFYIDTEGTIDDLRTDLQIPLRIILQ
jgi:uncharacterized protein YfaP (DUF2135 family)